MVEAK